MYMSSLESRARPAGAPSCPGLEPPPPHFTQEVLLLNVLAVEFNGGVEDGNAVEPLVGYVGQAGAVDRYGGGPDEASVRLSLAAELAYLILVDGNLVDAEDPVAVVTPVDHVEVVVGVQAHVDGVAEYGGVADGVAVAELPAADGCCFHQLFHLGRSVKER